jgi:hypothetical protein
MPIFTVKPRNLDADHPAQTRLIKAERRSQVESFILGDLVIEKAGTEEAVELGAAGVKVEAAA